MSDLGWVQAVCWDDWVKRNPGRPIPDDIPQDAGAWDRCAYCGKVTHSGIYVRDNPLSVPFPLPAEASDRTRAERTAERFEASIPPPGGDASASHAMVPVDELADAADTIRRLIARLASIQRAADARYAQGTLDLLGEDWT